MLCGDMLCDPFDLVIAPQPPAGATAGAAAAGAVADATPAAAAAAAEAALAALDAMAWDAAPAAAPAAEAAAPSGARSGGGSVSAAGAHAAAAAPAAAPGAAAAPRAGSQLSEGSRPCSPRGAAGPPAPAASVVTPGGGAWSAAPGCERSRGASPAVSSGAAPDTAPHSALLGAASDGAPLAPPELAALLCAKLEGAAARSGEGDLLVVSDGPLAPQPLLLAATEGLPAGGGWETASYTCVVPAQEGCACAPAPADDALLALRRVAAEVRARWPAAARVVLARRGDAVAPGEVAVVVAVTTPSWAASIAAVTFAVTCLKAAGASQ